MEEKKVNKGASPKFMTTECLPRRKKNREARKDGELQAGRGSRTSPRQKDRGLAPSLVATRSAACPFLPLIFILRQPSTNPAEEDGVREARAP